LTGRLEPHDYVGSQSGVLFNIEIHDARHKPIQTHSGVEIIHATKQEGGSLLTWILW